MGKPGVTVSYFYIYIQSVTDTNESGYHTSLNITAVLHLTQQLCRSLLHRIKNFYTDNHRFTIATSPETRSTEHFLVLHSQGESVTQGQ